MNNAVSWQNAVDLSARLQPELDLLEKKRKEHLLFLVFFIPVACTATLLPVYFLIMKPAGLAFLPSLGAMFLLGCAVSIYSYHGFDHDYRRKAKRIFIYRMAEMLGIKYNPQGLFATGQVYDHYIIPPYNIDKTEDGFIFKLADRRVELQETTLIKVPDGMRHSAPFRLPKKRDIIIRFESRKTMPFHIVVVPRGARYNAAFRGMRHHERTPFGNPAFARRYDLLSEDHTDAHDIFDHAFVETFLEFEKECGAKWLAASFKKREVVFYAKNGRDLFEPGHLLSPVTTGSLRQIFDELEALKKLVEVLKLNPYVGL